VISGLHIRNISAAIAVEISRYHGS